MEKLEFDKRPVFLVDPRLVDIDLLNSADLGQEFDGALFICVEPEKNQTLRDAMTAIPREDIPHIIAELTKALENN